MKQTYHGSCHCEAIRIEADIDLAAGTMKCNCSICAKARNRLVMVPADEFRQQAGENELSEYRFGERHIHHLFCRNCSVRVFGWGEASGGRGVFYAVNVACLDDADPAELAAAPVTYADGRNNRWQSAPAETAHL